MLLSVQWYCKVVSYKGLSSVRFMGQKPQASHQNPPSSSSLGAQLGEVSWSFLQIGGAI